MSNEESAGGRGISEALELAGFTNLDVVRNPSLGPTPYMARVQLHQTIGFTGKTAASARGPFGLATEVPERRLELRVGKMGLPDFFDLNSIGTDSHLQFMNWTTDNNGAWDYAADTRGYTYAAVAEYDDKNWSGALRPCHHADCGQRHQLRLEPEARQRPEYGSRVAAWIAGDSAAARAQGNNAPARLRQPWQHGRLPAAEH